MLKSMTGYASFDGSRVIGERIYQYSLEARSVNGKTLDIRFRLPAPMSDLDQALRAIVAKKLARGNVQLTLSIDRMDKGESLVINEALLAQVLDVSHRLTKEHALAPLSVEGALSIRGVVELRTHDETAEEKKAFAAAMTEELSRLLDRLVESRAIEGAALLAILQTTLNRIEQLVDAARHAPERQPQAIGVKLAAQIAAVMETGHGFNPERLHQEALLVAAKADIQEEIDRLDAHIAAARGLFSLAQPVGRQLDFLAQEFNREANTICSKANDIAITKIGLAMKAAIEQFREQIQNVE